MSLTAEQKIRIEENKARAREILIRKQEAAAQQPQQKPDDVALLCVNVSDCKSILIEQTIYESYGERICSVCKLKTNEYDMISKGDATSTYLVTDDSLTTLKFKTRDNPHHSNWTPMKLYLRKHVLELSMKRFGTMEKLADEKRARETLKYEKSLSKTVDIFSSSTEGLREQLSENPDSSVSSSSYCDVVEAKRKRNGAVANESQKRKKNALNSLVGIIRGDSKK